MPALEPQGRRRRWSDHKVLVLACLGGLVLIATPPLVLGLSGPAGSPQAGSLPAPMTRTDSTPATAPAVPLSTEPAAPANMDATGRIVVIGRGLAGNVERNMQRIPAGGPPVGWSLTAPRPGGRRSPRCRPR